MYKYKIFYDRPDWGIGDQEIELANPASIGDTIEFTATYPDDSEHERVLKVTEIYHRDNGASVILTRGT
jgi:hypothetical protein